MGVCVHFSFPSVLTIAAPAVCELLFLVPRS